MKKIEHYMLPENTNTLYENEAISSIYLTKEVADKINEIVDRLNEIAQADLEWKQTQEGTIRKGVLFMKDNLANSLQDLFNILHQQGFIDGRIEHHAQELSARLDAVLGQVKAGSTSMDAEVIDGRVGDNSTIYDSLGEAIRAQFHAIVPEIYLYYGVEYDTTTGVVTVLASEDNNILYTVFKRAYTAATPATISVQTATYDASANRPNAVVLNVGGGHARLKCALLNEYVPEHDDHLLFLIYQNRIVPVGLKPECIKVDGMYLSDNPTDRKLYNSGIVGLNGKLTINQETQEITMEEGFYIFPMDKVGAVKLTEQTVSYDISGVVTYLILDENNTLSVVNRNYIFKRGQYCLGCIYNGRFVPVELSEASVVYTASGKEVIETSKSFITINDMFRTLSDTTKTTKIVLGGDSITHGVGGTGYAQNGDTIITVGSNTYKRNTSGTCWANKFKAFIESNFNATVLNNGCSGTYSGFWDDHKGTLIPSDTDIFILTIGTNDRNQSTLTGSTKSEALTNYYERLTSIVDYCHSHGIQIVLCSPIPATKANESESIRLAHMFDINAVIQRVASEHNMEYANLYSEMAYHIKNNGLNISELLPDGLHPGDTMYDLMFYAYLKLFNIGPHYDYIG